MPRVNLEGSSSIVTGGASGIGEACARQLAAAGSKVVIADLNEEKGSQIAEEIGGIFVKCDVTSTDDADAAVAAACELGPLRACVNSAGLGNPGRTGDRNNEPVPLEQFTLADYERQMAVNMTSVFLGTQAAVAAMRRSGGGVIVNLSSVAGLVGVPGVSVYGASKGGVRLFTKAVALECARDNIRCNSVHPG